MGDMQIIPAIDIRGGKVVRLTQGLANRQKVYSDSPVDMAKKWDSFGVDLIHLVDLDGAFEGELKNLDIVRDIARSVKAKVELGGGMRTEEAVKNAIDSGVAKVVLGTKALDEAFLGKVVGLYGDKIVVGVDVRDGVVCTKGWVEKTKVKVIDLVRRLEKAGVKTINYTDISRDGMLVGPNIKGIRDLLEETNMRVVVGGGVSAIEDVRKLSDLADFGLAGIIIGKALYEGTIELGEAIKIGSGKTC
jgi:phosphoribosylformimino-5-aminoimidazole carboxamide ribotide isomerase